MELFLQLVGIAWHIFIFNCRFRLRNFLRCLLFINFYFRDYFRDDFRNNLWNLFYFLCRCWLLWLIFRFWFSWSLQIHILLFFRLLYLFNKLYWLFVVVLIYFFNAHGKRIFSSNINNSLVDCLQLPHFCFELRVLNFKTLTMLEKRLNYEKIT